MKIIYIDTSIQGFAFSVIDVSSQKVISKHVDTKTRATSVLLSNSIKKVFFAEKMSIKDISAVVVSVGPGSFTGIRMGLAWVSGFTVASRAFCKVIGASSFSLLSECLRNLNEVDQCFVLMKNSRKSGFLSCARKNTDPSVSIFMLEDNLQIFKEQSQKSLFIDDSWSEIIVLLQEQDITFTPISRSFLAEKAFESLIEKVQIDLTKKETLHFPKPLYLRGSSAEENLLKQKG